MILNLPSQVQKSLIALILADPKNTVVVVSGRDQSTLEGWLGSTRVNLVAEHGAFYKDKTGWYKAADINDQWKPEVRQILEGAAENLIGSLVEEKQTALVFHYRAAKDKAAAKRTVKELIAELAMVVGTTKLSVVGEAEALEVRMAGFNKGQIVEHYLRHNKYDFIFCAGDSTTDEDMFKATPERAVTIKVGSGDTAAQYRAKDQKQLLQLLTTLAP
jgi:trehalose 6-phosphate synthase/phosphatase